MFSRLVTSSSTAGSGPSIMVDFQGHCAAFMKTFSGIPNSYYPFQPSHLRVNSSILLTMIKLMFACLFRYWPARKALKHSKSLIHFFSFIHCKLGSYLSCNWRCGTKSDCLTFVFQLPTAIYWELHYKSLTWFHLYLRIIVVLFRYWICMWMYPAVLHVLHDQEMQGHHPSRF